MKKLLAILCTVAILFGSVFTGIVVSANTATVKYYNASSLQGYTLGSFNSGELSKPLSAAHAGSYVFTVNAVIPEGQLGRLRLADSSNLGYGYFIQNGLIRLTKDGGGKYGDDVTNVSITTDPFKLQIKATVMDVNGDGTNDTRFQIYINDQLMRTDDITSYTPTVTQVTFRNIGFTNPDPTLSTDAAKQYTADDIDGYTMGTSNTSDLYKPFNASTTGSYVFTAKATVGAGTLARFRLADSGNNGYGYLLQDNWVGFRYNGGGGAIGQDLTVEGLKINNNTFKLQIKATVMDIEGDGFDDTRMELYIDDVLVRTDDVKDYTPTVTQVIFREIAFDKLDPVFSTDPANQYNADSIGSYTQGTISSSDTAASLASPADGNYVFTAKATVGSGLARFRIANSQDLGYGYFLEDNKVYMRQNGGGAAIGTDLTVDGLKINNNTFKLQIKATVADFDGDGLDDTRMELYIDDVLVRTDDLKDFTPVAARIIFREIGFENPDPIFSDVAPNYYTPSDLNNYTQGSYTDTDLTKAFATSSTGSYVFTAKATIPAGIRGRFRIGDNGTYGYGYNIQDNLVRLTKDGGGQYGTDVTDFTTPTDPFKLQIKATVADIDGDGLDDTRMELFINDALIRTDDIKDFIPKVVKATFRNLGLENPDLVVSDATPYAYIPSELNNYTLGDLTTNNTDISKAFKTATTGNFVFTAKATTDATYSARFRFAATNDTGYGYIIGNNSVNFQKNGGGAAIAVATTTEKNYLGASFDIQVKVDVVDADGDGFDDTRYELYLDGALIRTDIVKDYTFKVAKMFMRGIGFENPDPVVSAADTMYLSPSSFNYTLGTGIDGDINVQRVQNPAGNIVFIAEATLNANGGAKFRIAGADWEGHGYAFGSDKIIFQKNGGGTAINTYAIAESYSGKTVVLKYVATVVDIDGDGLDDTLYELYINGEKVCSDYVKDFTQRTGRLCASKMSFNNYVAETKERTEIDAGTLVAPGDGLNSSDKLIPLGKNVTAECLAFNAVVKTGASGVKFRFADKDWEGYGYSFDKNTVTFQKNGGGAAIATSAASTKGTYLNTIFKLRVEVTAVDTNYDEVNDSTNFKLYIDGDLILDNTVDGYDSSIAIYCCVSKIAFYKEDVLTGGASVSSSIVDEDDTKISFSHLGLPTGKHYEGDGKGHASAAYEGSILNTVFEGKVMLENGGFLRYPAHKTGWHGIQLEVSGTSLLIKEVSFDANGNGATNDVLATITSDDIGGAVIPATAFDLTVHINTSSDEYGEVWDDYGDDPVAVVDNIVTVTYYINGYEVYSCKSVGMANYELDEDGYLIEDSVKVEGGPALYDNFVLIHGLKGEFTDSNSADNVKVKTPADYLGNMSYGKYTSNKTNGAWTLGLNEGFTTDLIIEEGTPVGDIIHNTIGSLRTYADGSLRFQVYIDNSGTTYRLTNAVADGGKNYVGTQFNYKITAQDVDHDGDGLPNDLAIGVFIDGKLCNNEYIYVDNVVRKMSDQNFTIFAGVELIAPTIETADDGYVVITPEDFGIDLGKYTNISGASTYFFNSVELNHASKSINGKRFETKIKFIGANGQNSYIAFGNTSATRLVIYPSSENSVVIRTFLGGTNNGAYAVIPNLTANKVHDLALTFDYVNGNLKVGIYVDGEWVLDFWANGIGSNAYLLTKFGAFSKTKDVGIQFGEDAIPEVCNIDEGVYFIEYIEGATYLLDGEEIEVTEEGYELWLDEPHAYNLEIVKGIYSTTKIIVAYYENDLNGDATVDVLDFIAMMKNTMEDEFTDYVAMAAAGKTSLADVCKPKDLVLMKKILLGIA